MYPDFLNGMSGSENLLPILILIISWLLNWMYFSSFPLFPYKQVVKMFAEALEEIGNLDASTLFHYKRPRMSAAAN